VDFLTHFFPVAGIRVNILIPPLFSFIVSFFTSMGGVSGAFILLPFQMSVLGYTTPSVSATNQLYNIVAIPSGVYRYMKEKRMVWPLAWATIICTLPGVFIGAWIRIKYLPDAKNFKFFAGLVLLYLGIRLLQDVLKKQAAKAKQPEGGFDVVVKGFSLKKIEFSFVGESFSFSPINAFWLCFVVGIVGGIYGIGGGAIIAPFFVAIFKLPVYAVAGAALMGTFVTSIAGVVFYQILSWFEVGKSAAPDWLLGFLFGIGGFMGMYLGARFQKFVPAKAIKMILCACVMFVAVTYIYGFFK